MYFFQKRFSLLILLFTLPLLFLPKINLIKVGSETAGIRIDDVVLMTLGILFCWAHLLLNKKIEKIELWILGITLFSFISFFMNKLLVASEATKLTSKIFYTVRLLEYFIFFYIGVSTAKEFKSNRVIRVFFLWNFVLMLLQKNGLIGGITVEGYNLDVSARAQGVASFPSEMGLLLNLLFCYLIYDEKAPSKILFLFPAYIRKIFKNFYIYWMFGIFGVLIAFTGNRISLVALLVCFLYKMIKEVNFKSTISLMLFSFSIFIFILGGAFVIMKTASLYERSTSLFSLKNMELAKIVWNRIDLSIDPISESVIPAENYDMSWWLRIHKWTYIVKAFVTTPFVYLQGLGPGTAWSALDGGWLRIVVEYGVIGACLFYGFFSSLYRINIQTKWMMIAFGINMVFFDAYLAYKTMSFLLFSSGYAWQHEKIKQQEQKQLSKAKLDVCSPLSPSPA